MLAALPAFWAGLLYDQGALDAAWDLVKGWTAEDRAALRADVPTQALKAKVRGRSLQELAQVLLGLSEAGLKARAKIDGGHDESVYLAPLQEIAASGITQAERLLSLYHGDWGGDVTKAYTQLGV